ncbi:MAG: hypothetical protein HYZ72_21020, partial [Deltaproteobacteria bacterium]|nr:hypothetical protein [Deltaproteobacteria bacterium]
LGFAASLLVLFAEHGLRLGREAELSDKTAELSEKESRVSSLTEQIASRSLDPRTAAERLIEGAEG